MFPPRAPALPLRTKLHRRRARGWSTPINIELTPVSATSTARHGQPIFSQKPPRRSPIDELVERFDRVGGGLAKTHYSSGYGLINGRAGLCLLRSRRPVFSVTFSVHWFHDAFRSHHAMDDRPHTLTHAHVQSHILSLCGTNSWMCRLWTKAACAGRT